MDQLIIIESASVVPSDISGLQLWLRSDLGVTKDGSNFVSSWADQSGNGRDVTEATNKPLWVTSLINGQPAIRFDGVDDKLSSASFTRAQPMTFFVVMKEVSYTLGDRVFATDAGVGAAPNLLQNSGLVIQSNSTNGATVTTDQTSYHYYKCVFNGTSSVISKDGGADQTSGNTLTGSATILHLGWSGGGNYANIEIAELLLYDSTISGTNLTNINAYFAARYGL